MRKIKKKIEQRIIKFKKEDLLNFDLQEDLNSFRSLNNNVKSYYRMGCLKQVIKNKMEMRQICKILNEKM